MHFNAAITGKDVCFLNATSCKIILIILKTSNGSLAGA